MAEPRDYSYTEISNKADSFYDQHKYDSEKAFNEAVYKELRGMKFDDDKQDFLKRLVKESVEETRFAKYDDPKAILLKGHKDSLNNAWNLNSASHDYLDVGERTKERTLRHPIDGEYTDRFIFKEPAAGSAKLYEVTKKASDQNFDFLEIDKIPGYDEV
jgi:hypothetical protein